MSAGGALGCRQVQQPLLTSHLEAHMKKLTLLAVLFMATSSAHAGNGISFEIDGQHIRIEAPRHCDQLSCIKISAPGYNGSLGGLKNSFKSNRDDDDVADTPAPAAPAPAPVQAAAPQPPAPATATAVPPPAPPTTIAAAPPAAADVAPSAPATYAPQP